MFWQQILGSDGVTRHLQWQARVEGKTNSKHAIAVTRKNADGPPASMTITQYVGTGSTSRGRMAITPALTTRVSVAPYLREAADKEAVVQGIEYIRGVLNQIQNLTWIAPALNQSTTAFVNSVCLARRSMCFC
jgi:cellobiose dehydrogenase (acceptor)